MPRMPLAERRERLVTAAVDVISDGGVSAATTRAIVARADMPLASFHYAFESHTALMVAVVERIQELDARAAEGTIVPGRTLVETVEHGLHAFLDSVVADVPLHLAETELRFWALRQPGQETLTLVGNDNGREKVLTLLRAYREHSGAELLVDDVVVADHLLAVTGGLELQYFYSRDIEALRRTIPAMAAGFASYEKA